MSSDSKSSQIFEACGRKKNVADLLEYLMGVFEWKRRRNPKEPLDSPVLWMDMTRDYLSSKLRCSPSTIKRASAALVARGLVVIHRSDSTKRTLRYELKSTLADTLFQPLELFDQADAHLVKMTKCNWSERPDATGQDDQMQSVNLTSCTIPLSSSCNPSITIMADDDVLEDEEKKKLVRDYRLEGIVPEQTEFLMTKHTRQLMQAALAYVAGRKRHEVIVNPAGVIHRFLEAPGRHGYEMNKQGVWVHTSRLAVNNQPIPVHNTQSTPVIPPSKRIQERWKHLNLERRQELLQSITHPFAKDRVMAWKSREPGLETVPEAIAAHLEGVLCE